MAAMKKTARPWYVLAKSLLREKKITLEDVAERCHVTFGAVGHWLNGRRDPTIEQIQEIAKMVGKSISELCGEDAYFIVEGQERALIDAFRRVGEQEKELILKMLKKVPPEEKMQ
jgi:transcriptional regulator with XRE-family HTH domain